MNLFLILFFISLISIAVIVGRKIILLRRGMLVSGEQNNFEIPYIEEVKHITIKKLKRYGYVVLINTIRISMKSTHFAKNKGTDIVNKLKNKVFKQSLENGDPQEVSKFLQMVGEYKHKIKKIKHRIRKEEGID